MCVSLNVRLATVTTRITRSCVPYIGTLQFSVPARVSSFVSLHKTVLVVGFVPRGFYALCLLCAFAPLLVSLFVSIRCSSQSSALLILLCLSSLVLLCLSSRRRLICVHLCICVRLCFCIRLYSALVRRLRLLNITVHLL